MRKILVSAGDLSGVSAPLLHSISVVYKSIQFDAMIDEDILKRYFHHFNLKIPKNINCISINAKSHNPVIGKASTVTSKIAFESLKNSFDVMQSKNKDYLGLLTLPVNKESISRICRTFTGHTEYLSQRAKKDVVMILYSKKISVALLTTHVRLASVEKSINEKTIKNKVAIISDFYRSHLKKNPSMLFLCVNPHCSDNGLLGCADIDLKRIVSELKRTYKISGPVSADSAFTAKNIENHDLIFGMYHDQVLIPFKMISFYDGINITAGLPFIRVSPDHGPAYDIAPFIEKIDTTSSLKCIEFLIKKSL